MSTRKNLMAHASVLCALAGRGWAIALCLLPFDVYSATVTLDAIDSGTYAFRACPDCVPFERNLGTEYDITRDPGYTQDSAYEFRAFLVFDLSGISDPSVFTSATLLLQNSGCPAYCVPFQLGPHPATVLFFDVTTPIATLRSPFPPGAKAIFDDLGSGQLFGAHTLQNADYSLGPGLLTGAIVSIPLNGAAVAAINAARGQLFALGGVIGPNEFGSIFGATGASPFFVRGLVLTTDTVANPPFRVVGVGDFNGDGHADVLWFNANSGALVEWLLDGQGNVIANPILSSTCGSGCYPQWQVVGVGDFNGDRRADVLWFNAKSGALGEWLLDGQGNVISSPILSGACGSGCSPQ